MKSKNPKDLAGLVVNLPNSNEKTGIVLDSTKYGRNYYKLTILCKDYSVIIAKCKLNKPEVNETIEYVDFHWYKTGDIVKVLR